MKKVISIALVLVLALSVFAMVGCGKDANTDTDAPAATLKFGMGVVAAFANAKDADGDTNGGSEFNTTAVAVLLDADNKIVAIDLDTAQIKTAWTSEGKIVATEDFRTKYDKGTDYGMAAYGYRHDGTDGEVLEWDVQAAEFDKALVGKTAADFAAFADETGYATGDLATAGCTINVNAMIQAATAAVA